MTTFAQAAKSTGPWERIMQLADDFFLKPQILDPWPHERFAVNHPRWGPSA
jgi:hypothetical protein